MSAALPPLRSALATLRAAAEDSGRALQAEAYGRLALLDELGECLGGETTMGGGAADVSEFCGAAFTRLSSLDPGPEADSAAEWFLAESSDRWGHYLGLIDGGDPEFFEPDPNPLLEDAPAAIDTGTLVRLLTGAGASPPPTPPDGNPTVVPTPPLAAFTIDPELRDTFLAEGTDLFERLEALVLGLGHESRDTETLHELGRCFHTLKGAAGSVGLVGVAALIHSVEEELETSEGVAGDGLVGTLHGVLHDLDKVFADLRHGRAVGGAVAEDTPLRGVPSQLGDSHPRRRASDRDGERRRPADPVAVAPRPEDSTASSLPFEPPGLTTRGPTATPGEAPAGEGPLRVPAEKVDELMDHVSELIARRGLWTAQMETMKEFAAAARMCRHRLSGTIDRLRAAGAFLEAPAPAGRARRGSDRTDLPGLLLRLIEQAEDLAVLAESTEAASAPWADNSEALGRTSRHLWESLQAIRIVPVRGLFQRLARVAHDAARVEGRQVTVALVGEETGVDRALQDKAFEPLLHVVRNAVSHGIEPPDGRRAAGKPPTGRVVLEASRIGHTIVLSVSDDGRGLDYAAIEAKGRRLGLLAPSDRPGIDRLNALIFRPGFSTREAANAIAGRGVGMDVVSQEVGRLHGTIELESQSGHGTRLSLRLPARLALQQAMVLRVDGCALSLPVETVELAQPLDADGVDGDGPTRRVLARDQWVPLVSARDAIGLPPVVPGSCPKLLLIRADGGVLAVQVDSIDGTSELVFKPLGPLLSGHPFVSGTSLSVAGEVVLALNPSTLARCVGGGCRPDPVASVSTGPDRAATVLVVDDSISVRKVVARQIRALGLVVEEVSDGLEALGRLRTRSYGLVVSDLEMPRMDGFELLAELGRLAITPAVPVVMASTRTDPETRRKAWALGACGFLGKPIDSEALAAVVREQLPSHVRPPFAAVEADRGMIA